MSQRKEHNHLYFLASIYNPVGKLEVGCERHQYRLKQALHQKHCQIPAR